MSGFLWYPLTRVGLLTARPHAGPNEPGYTLHDQDEHGNERETLLYAPIDLAPRLNLHIGKRIMVTGSSLSEDQAYMQVMTFLVVHSPPPPPLLGP